MQKSPASFVCTGGTEFYRESVKKTGSSRNKQGSNGTNHSSSKEDLSSLKKKNKKK